MVVWRTQKFRDGQMPSVDATLEALAAKYGPPQVREISDSPRGYSAGTRDLQWVYDRSGNPLSEANPLFGRCRNGVYAGGENTGASWTDGCGLNISARVVLSGNNPGLVMELHTAMIQQSTTYAYIEGMQADNKKVSGFRAQACNAVKQQAQMQRRAQQQQAQGAAAADAVKRGVEAGAGVVEAGGEDHRRPPRREAPGPHEIGGERADRGADRLKCPGVAEGETAVTRPAARLL